jgi:hypothetical protein
VCKNKGHCTEGTKDHGILNATILSVLAKTANEDFEHCQCPTGFAGLACDEKANVCREDKHVCVNGGTVSLKRTVLVECRTYLMIETRIDRFASVAGSALSMRKTRMSATAPKLSRTLEHFASTRLPPLARTLISVPTVESVPQKAK